MNSDEDLTQLVHGVSKLCLMQQGQIAALRTVTEALVGAVGLNLPPLAGEMSSHIDSLTRFHRDGLEPESQETFDSTLGNFRQILEVLGRKSR